MGLGMPVENDGSDSRPNLGRLGPPRRAQSLAWVGRFFEFQQYGSRLVGWTECDMAVFVEQGSESLSPLNPEGGGVHSDSLRPR